MQWQALLAICVKVLHKEWPSTHAWGSLHVGRGPLLVWSVSCMQSSFFRYHFDPMQHDPWLLHGHWFLVLVTLALWSSALGPWLYIPMHALSLVPWSLGPAP